MRAFQFTALSAAAAGALFFSVGWAADRSPDRPADCEDEVLMKQMALRDALIEGVAEGRVSVEAAAAQFLEMDRARPEVLTQVRERFPAPTDEESARLQVIAFAELHRRSLTAGGAGLKRRAGVQPPAAGGGEGSSGPAQGSRTRKVVPRPDSVSKSMVPPWDSTALLQIASPSPVPPEARERALSTR